MRFPVRALSRAVTAPWLVGCTNAIVAPSGDQRGSHPARSRRSPRPAVVAFQICGRCAPLDESRVNRKCRPSGANDGLGGCQNPNGDSGASRTEPLAGAVTRHERRVSQSVGPPRGVRAEKQQATSVGRPLRQDAARVPPSHPTRLRNPVPSGSIVWMHPSGRPKAIRPFSPGNAAAASDAATNDTRAIPTTASRTMARLGASRRCSTALGGRSRDVQRPYPTGARAEQHWRVRRRALALPWACPGGSAARAVHSQDAPSIGRFERHAAQSAIWPSGAVADPDQRLQRIFTIVYIFIGLAAYRYPSGTRRDSAWTRKTPP